MNAACAEETHAFCAYEANLLALVASAPHTTDDQLHQRQDQLHACLVDHANDLSPPCVAALVGNMATQYSALPTSETKETKETTSEETKETKETEQTKATKETEATKEIEETKEIPSAVLVKITPSPAMPPLQPQYVQTSGDVETGIEVRIVLIHHPGQGLVATAPQQSMPSYVRVGGDATPQEHKTSGMGASPWLWVLMMPFICIGMYVSIVQILAFVRRQRDAVYRVGSSQYMPIPTSLNPSKPLRSTPPTNS